MSLAIGLDGNGYASWSRTKDGRESKQIAVKISWIDNANIKQPCAFFSHLAFLINSTTVNVLPTKATTAITTRRHSSMLIMSHGNFSLDFKLLVHAAVALIYTRINILAFDYHPCAQAFIV